MRIGLDGKPEMSGRLVSGHLGDILTAAEQLQYSEGKNWKILRVGLALLAQKLRECFCIRAVGKLHLVLGCQLDDAIPFFGGANDPSERWDPIGFEKPRR